MRVLYFTGVPLMAAANGGSICCRNHVMRLAAEPRLELFGLVTGPADRRAGTEAFFAEVGAPLRFEALAPFAVQPTSDKLVDLWKFANSLMFPFAWESRVANQGHVQSALDQMIKAHAIDAVVIDYHPSAMYLDLPRRDVATVLIGLNREGDFFSEMLRRGYTHHGRFSGPISLRRARSFERRTNAAVDKVVVIGPPDLPRQPLRSRAECITPYLNPKPSAWRPTGKRQAFFVGDINHWPNLLAIQWIVDKLAPALLERGSDVRIAILGADAHEAQRAALPANVDFLGRGDAHIAADLFQTAGLMLCPVENDYGVKFKALEALSYGCPLLASRQTLLGLPHIKGLPSIDLRRPAEAAETVVELFGDQERLRAMHRAELEQQQSFIATQGHVWSKTIRAAIEARARRIGRSVA